VCPYVYMHEFICIYRCIYTYNKYKKAVLGLRCVQIYACVHALIHMYTNTSQSIFEGYDG